MSKQATQEPRFSDGVALVVGGTGAIGKAICLALAAAGSNVVLTYNTRKAVAEDIAAQIEAMGKKAEIARLQIENAEEVVGFCNSVVRRHGRIHSVVYASRSNPRMAGIAEIKPADWAKVVAVEVEGCFNLVHATLPYLRNSDGAYVAITDSAIARPVPGDVQSAAPKAAIEMFLRGLAKEEGRNGIRVNCVSPGFIQPEPEADRGFTDNDSSEIANNVVKAIPLKRLGRAEEVGNAALFLLSSKASYITGHSIAVDGGLQI